MLGQLVALNVTSLGACPAPVPVLISGDPQPSLPKRLAPKEIVNVHFTVTYDGSCMNDPAKTTLTNPGHDDFVFTASVNHAALDGQADTHTVDDVCPRIVTLPGATDPYPNNKILDKGCGRPRADGTFGDPVTADLYR